jgi:hypothetical protein
VSGPCLLFCLGFVLEEEMPVGDAWRGEQMEQMCCSDGYMIPTWGA